MNLKSLLGILGACVSGFLGGILAPHDHVEASSPSVLRASRFELVNGAGATVAYWEVDSKDNVRLRLLPAARVRPLTSASSRTDSLFSAWADATGRTALP